MKPVELNGVVYASIADAIREGNPLRLTPITIRQRLRRGWSMEDAFGVDTIVGSVPAKMARSTKASRS